MINDLIDQYLLFIKSQKGLSANTIIAYQKDLHKFSHFLARENLALTQLKRFHIRTFLAELSAEKLIASSINRILAAVKGFIRYQIRNGYKDSSQILEIESLRSNHKLPDFLFDRETEQLLGFSCIKKNDFRDKAMIELLFSTGVRVSELINLDFNQLDLSQKMIRVIGKGDKERIVLFGSKCSQALKDYLKIRPNFKPLPGEKAIFLNKNGQRLSDRGVRHILCRRIKQTALAKNISPHSLRHSFASSLLRNGADIRTVQTLLGHAQLSTTQIYTHLGLDELKDIHYHYHPHGK